MKYAITNVKILDGHKDMKVRDNSAILVDGEKIADIVDFDKIPQEYKIIDMGGKYILPGLINLHVHIPASGKPKKKKTNYEKLAKLLRISLVRAVIFIMCKGLAKQQLMSGTTTIRAVGGVLDFDTKLRDKINKGKAVGPRILAADCAISVPGGHMTGSVAEAANSPEEAVAMVNERKTRNPDLIKLMITGGVLDAIIPGEPGVLKMPKEYVKAATDEAHKLGLKVAAHVESGAGMEVALECGVDTLEHGGKPNDRIIEMFKEKGSALVATLSPAFPFTVMDRSVTGFTETDLINGNALFNNMVDCIKACIDNGITVGLGTDTGCPFITQYDMWRELWYFSKYIGVSAQFALYSATEGNAKIVGIDKETGSIDVGKSADFMVVENNPLEDLRALRTPKEVFYKGKRIVNPKQKKIPFVEEQLDKIMDL